MTTLVRACRGHDRPCADRTCSRGEYVAAVRCPLEPGDVDALLDRRLDRASVACDAFDDFLARQKAVRVRAVVWEAGQREGPVGDVERERVPSTAAPAVGHAGPVEHDMIDSRLRQVIAGRESRLSGSDHRNVHLPHAAILPELSTSTIVSVATQCSSCMAPETTISESALAIAVEHHLKQRLEGVASCENSSHQRSWLFSAWREARRLRSWGP